MNDDKLPLLAFELFHRSDWGAQLFRVEDPNDPGALRMIAQNEAAGRLTGVDMSDLVGRTLGESMPEFLESEFPARYLRAGLTGRPDSWEVSYTDSRFPTATWQAQAIPLDERHVAIVFRNITAQREAEAQVRERSAELERANEKLAELASSVSADLDRSEARFRAVLEQVPAIVWTMDRSLVIQSSTGSGLPWLGLETNQLVGMTLQEYVRTSDTEEPAIAAHLRALDGEPSEYEYELMGRVLDVRVHPLRSPEQKIIGVVGVCLDMTERRQLEQSLQQRQRLESVGQLAGGIAHDFNNLLTVIVGQCTMLRDAAIRSNRRHAELDEVLVAAERGARLTNQLLAFARKQVTHPVPIDLNEVITTTATMLRRLLGEDVELVIHAGSRLGVVMSDRGYLEQIVMNLAINARDAMPDGGKLEITTDNADVASDDDGESRRYVRLRVRDSGMGMSPETASRCFEPFFTTKQGQGGTGLGLSTVFGIVDQAGGRIEVHTQPDRGSTFVIWLPRTGDPAIPTEIGIAEPSLAMTSGATVLVVEDNEQILNLAARVLSQRALSVLTAASGVEALRVAEAHSDPIDVLLTDVVMPGMGGVELAERLRAQRPDLAVICMSGYPNQRLAEDVPFLAKPFRPDELVAIVTASLKAREQKLTNR